MNYIYRTISESIKNDLQYYQAIVITGPRQVGKTTLCKKLFPDYDYVNLENIPTREIIREDIQKFIDNINKGIIIDEVHHLPELFSYIQVAIDEKKGKHFILTGSNNFGMLQHVTQSLAGRASIFSLPPLSLNEIDISASETSTDELLYKGLYPAAYSVGTPPSRLYANYYSTYIERDMHQLIKVKDLSQFQLFIRLCAGRVGSEYNFAALSNETGVSAPTIKEWLSILEASYIIFKLPPFHTNINKRLVKSPKLYFYDTGILCLLLGIENPQQLSTHPLRGAIFENLVVAEFIKANLNAGKLPNCYFYRDNRGVEIDLIKQSGNEFCLYEIKSSKTFNPTFLKNIKIVSNILGEQVCKSAVLYDGKETRTSQTEGIYNFRNFTY